MSDYKKESLRDDLNELETLLSSDGDGMAVAVNMGTTTAAELVHAANKGLAQRDEAVALLRKSQEWIGVASENRAAREIVASIVGQVDAFLSRLDSKESGDAGN